MALIGETRFKIVLPLKSPLVLCLVGNRCGVNKTSVFGARSSVEQWAFQA